MSKYLYNDFELPAIPDSLDREQYPHLILTGSVDSSGNITFILTAWELPVSLYTNSEGKFVIAPEEGRSYNMGYYSLSSDESSWINFVQNSTPSTEQSLAWTDTDILNLDEGTIHLEASTPVSVEENTLLYNGIPLPILPNWDRKRYPYALISCNPLYGTYSVYFFDKKVVSYSSSLIAGYEGSYNGDFTYLYSSLKSSNGIRKINPEITDSGTTYSLMIEIDDGEVAWTNFDIMNYTGTTVAFAKSRPVDAVTGKEITLYDLPAEEVISRKFNIPSYLEGLKAGQLECSKRNPVPLLDNSDDFLSHGGIIPEGGAYYIGITSSSMGKYSEATTTLQAGDPFPEVMNDGDVYVYGDYEYRYNYYPSRSIFGKNVYFYKSSGNEWGVGVIDRTKETYGEALSIINGKNVAKTQALYNGCEALIKPPRLPKYAAYMNYAFYGCTALVDVSEFSIPKKVTNIDYAFSGCTALKKAPDLGRLFNVTSMHHAFNGCTSLEETPRIPPRVKSLHCAFNGCSSLTKVSEIPSNVENLSYAFAGCVLLTDVPKIPSSVKFLYSTFSGCTGLVHNREILNATKVTSMLYTFKGCTSLKEAHLPPNLVGGYEVFTGCTALESTPDYSYMKDCVTLEYTFQECTSLTTVGGLPPNIKYLDSAFYKCSALENIPAIPYGVESLYNCFSDTGLKEFPSLPDTVENISQLCRNCVNLTSVSPVIPSSVTNMTYLFSGCTGLKEVNGLSIPSKVTSISGLFDECTALEKVPNFIIHPNVTVFTYVFDGCIALTDISGFAFSAKAKDLGGCFQGCTSLGDVTGLVIPSEVNDMWYVFKSCTNLTGTIQVNVKSENIIYNTNKGNNSCYQCFMDTTKPITLKGTGDNTTVLNLLKGTATNSNVTVS